MRKAMSSTRGAFFSRIGAATTTKSASSSSSNYLRRQNDNNAATITTTTRATPRSFIARAGSSMHRRALTTTASAVSPGKKHGDLPKNFEHTDVEEPLYKRWEQSGAFKPKPNDDKEPFTIPMPPPNVTGALHMGHAMFVTIQDVMSRSMRMRGHPTLWLPGTDHAGIATQLVVERQLESEGLSRIGVGREEFEKRTWK